MKNAISQDVWIDEFLDAAQLALGAMDLATLQPTSWLHVHPLTSQEWLDWFYRIVQAQKRQKVAWEKLGKALHPALVQLHLMFTLEDAKVAQLPFEKRMEIANFFHNILRASKQSDYFSLHGTNLIHSPKEVEQIMQRKFVKGTPDAARALGRLHNAAYNLGAALYLDFYMDQAIQNDGPYELQGGRQLVVKEANSLRPTEIWPDISTSAEKIDIYAVYEGVDYSLDFISCHSQFQGDPIEGLREWRVEKDGNAIEKIGEIDALTEELALKGKTQWKKVISLKEGELLEKAVWIRCYIFKQMCELYGLDWKPSKQLLSANKGKTLEQGWSTWNAPAGEEEIKKYWRKIGDPRIEFYPQGASKGK